MGKAFSARSLYTAEGGIPHTLSRLADMLSGLGGWVSLLILLGGLLWGHCFSGLEKGGLHPLSRRGGF